MAWFRGTALGWVGKEEARRAPKSGVLLLDEVEAAGFAKRERDPADRRRHIVELTPEGRRAVEHAEAGIESVEGEVLTNLSAKERATLRGVLTFGCPATTGQDSPALRGRGIGCSRVGIMG